MYYHGWICLTFLQENQTKIVDVGVCNHSGYIRIEFAFYTTETTKQLIEGLGKK